ncbi:hypothetical protein RI367_002997 [Sorochytrium milnesiophthora]
MTLKAVVLLAVVAVVSAVTLPQTYTYELAGEPKRGQLQPLRVYQGHKIVRLQDPSNKVRSVISSTRGIDVWGGGPSHIDVRVANLDAVHQLESQVQEQLHYTVRVDNVQELVDKDTAGFNHPVSFETASSSAANWFADYHTYADTVKYLTATCKTYAKLCTAVPSIGKSIQGRDIIAFKLSGKGGQTKPQIYFQGLQHAREWAATTTTQYIFTQLLSSYGKDKQATQLLDTAEVLIVPIANPDGYVYTWTGERLWRKNRRDNGDGTFGVDQNRNFPFAWGKGGSSSDTSDETYMGKSPASEPEVKAMINYFTKNNRIVGAIDFHTFSQLILRPWGNTEADSPHEPQLKKVSDEVRDIIKGVHGSDYVSEKSIDLYVTTGTASDWFYTVKNKVNGKTVKPYGITIELRPDANNGGDGFILPKDQIIPTAQEIYPAALHYALNALASPLIDKGK